MAAVCAARGVAAGGRRRGRGTGKRSGTSDTKRHKRWVREQRRDKAGAAEYNGWPYETLMVLWDAAFEHALQELGHDVRQAASGGLAAYGRGAVLLTVRLATAGAGFGARAAKPSHFSAGEAPPWAVADAVVQYLPYDVIVSRDPARILEEAAALRGEGVLETGGPPAPGIPPVPSAEELGNLLGIQDLTRMLTLTHDPADPLQHQDVGGEKPYDPAAGELVLMLAAKVDDGPFIAGADTVLEADGALHTKLLLGFA